MIVVTGANGNLGRRIVDRLLTRIPAERVGVSVREPEKAKGLAERGVRVRHGSFTEPASLAEAFADADQVLLVSLDFLGETAVSHTRAAIAAAVAAGARRILYTSHMGASHSSRFQACRDHAAVEDALRACAVPFTALRNGFHASSAAWLLGQVAESGRVELPADGPVSWTAHDDLAEAAAAILADEGRFDGPTPPLTAGHAHDFAAMAPMLERITGREVTRVVVPDEDFRKSLVGNGVPDDMTDALLGMFQASRAGEFSAVDPTLERLIGRPPIPLETALEQSLAAGGRSTS
jgi:uncharacterized protein YbjT (DUF2867 family)